VYHSVPDPKDWFMMLSKITNAKFRKPVIPGDQIRLYVDIVRMRKRFCEVKGKAVVDGDIVVESEIIASLLHREEMNGRE